MKKCRHCEVKKSTSLFSKDKSRKDGLCRLCKDCASKQCMDYYRSIPGVISELYARQKVKSIKRGHAPPNYSKKEFSDWLLSLDNFLKLYNSWVYHNYESNYKPSVDRIDDYKPYSFENIRLVSWYENNMSHHEDRVKGINNKASTAVAQCSISGDLIAEHYSIINASRVTGICRTSISECCSGKQKTAGGFHWSKL